MTRAKEWRSVARMAEKTGGKVVINLATGLEGPERVTVAFLVAGAALEQGKRVGDVPDQGGGADCAARHCGGRGLRRLPPAGAPVRAVRRRRRRAAHVPDLLTCSTFGGTPEHTSGTSTFARTAAGKR